MLQDNEKSDPSCYITYEKYHFKFRDEDGLGDFYYEKQGENVTLNPSSPLNMEDNKQEAPAFRPRWLVDTSDMSVVPGSTVSEPYYTLSYSWNQSGDYIKNEHDDGYTRIDRGLHKIVLDPVVHDLEENETPPRVRYVKFEELVQEIFQDFGARYLWWDQMCIDQSNKEEKRREIKQMHKIYEEACATIVLVPEYNCVQFGNLGESMAMNIDFMQIMNSQWFKRVWTLVEGFKASKLVFVGRNTHMYSDMYARSHAKGFYGVSNSLSVICKKSNQWSACLGLSQSRQRSTSKNHDYYFAFANMFPEKLASLKFSYGQDIQELALDFYQRLVENDPTVLFFGAYDGEEKFEKAMLGPGLESSRFPSWTGIHGAHVPIIFDDGEFDRYSFGLSDGDYIVSGSTITVTCTSISVSILDELEYYNRCVDDIPAFADIEWVDPNVSFLETGAVDDHMLKELRTSGNNELTFVAKSGAIQEEEGLDFNLFGLKVTHYLRPVMDSSYQYHNVPAAYYVDSAKCADLLLTEECDNCIILYGMRHVWTTGLLYYITAPVIKKDGDYYKSIGLCMFTRNLVFPDIDTETKQTFVIR